MRCEVSAAIIYVSDMSMVFVAIIYLYDTKTVHSLVAIIYMYDTKTAWFLWQLFTCMTLRLCMVFEDIIYLYDT